jgi:hypothetical protein
MSGTNFKGCAGSILWRSHPRSGGLRDDVLPQQVHVIKSRTFNVPKVFPLAYCPYPGWRNAAIFFLFPWRARAVCEDHSKIFISYVWRKGKPEALVVTAGNILAPREGLNPHFFVSSLFSLLGTWWRCHTWIRRPEIPEIGQTLFFFFFFLGLNFVRKKLGGFRVKIRGF